MFQSTLGPFWILKPRSSAVIHNIIDLPHQRKPIFSRGHSPDLVLESSQGGRRFRRPTVAGAYRFEFGTENVWGDLDPIWMIFGLFQNREIEHKKCETLRYLARVVSAGPQIGRIPE